RANRVNARGMDQPDAPLAPSPLVGEGWGGGSKHSLTPTPALPPQGGGRRAPSLARRAGKRRHFFNGRNSILRKNTSAPSVWNRILPLVWLHLVPLLTTLPLRMFVMRSPSQIT